MKWCKYEHVLQNTPDDEVLEEIKKCLQELQTVNDYNIDETNQLKRLISNDLRLNTLKESLEKVDQQVKIDYNVNRFIIKTTRTLTNLYLFISQLQQL